MESTRTIDSEIHHSLPKLEDLISFYFSNHFNLLFDQSLYNCSTTTTLTFNRKLPSLPECDLIFNLFKEAQTIENSYDILKET